MLKRAAGWQTYVKKAPIQAMRAEKPGTIKTLEGVMKYRKGDMIAKGTHGDKWPIKKEIFAETHEKLRGATSLRRASGFAKAASFQDFWAHIKADPRRQEVTEPIRSFAAWAVTPGGKKALGIGAGVSLASAAGVAYLDKKQDETLFPK